MIDQATFFHYVQQVLVRLDDWPYLLGHPLAALLARTGQTASPEVLRGAVFGAVDQLRPPDSATPGSATWRRWRCLVLRHVEGLSTREIAVQLNVSERQVLRDHQAGVEGVAAILWARYSRQEGDRGSPASFGPESGAGLARPSGALWESVEAELARVSAVSPDETADLIEVLEGALTTVRGLIEARQAGFRVTFPDDLHPVAVSPTVLRQILLCLLTAALEGKPAPQIGLSAANAGDSIQLALAIRVPGRHRPDDLLGSNEAATLVGVARRLVEFQGGTLQVDAAPDGASRLVLALPATRTATVLVVDDNPDVVELFRWYLAGHNYRLVQARTPPTALELARELHPDVITLDVMMPSQDGWQILQQLRGDPAVRDIPVVVCSILPEQPLARSLGVADFLAKPVTPQSLLAALERCLGARRPARHPGCSEDTSSARPPSYHPPG